MLLSNNAGPAEVRKHEQIMFSQILPIIFDSSGVRRHRKAGKNKRSFNAAISYIMLKNSSVARWQRIRNPVHSKKDKYVMMIELSGRGGIS